MPDNFPVPVFDTLDSIVELHMEMQNADNHQTPIKNWLTHCFKFSSNTVPDYAIKDYFYAIRYIYSYRGSKDTFSSYRRELERLLQWSWLIHKQSILTLQRQDIEQFIEFCIKPPKTWISVKTATRFQRQTGEQVPHPIWRPFTARLSKQQNYAGATATTDDYKLSQAGIKAIFAILGSFYNFLMQEEATVSNPVALIRQKSKFLRKDATQPMIRKLSDAQWQLVINLAKENASKDQQGERDVFILSCLYGMYLRISELITTNRWAPTMGDFFQDDNQNWWFKTVGKGNKIRQIAVSDAMLDALCHYRLSYLDLPAFPLPGEQTPLIGHRKNPNNPITSDFTIRALVQNYFNLAADKLSAEGDEHAANIMRTATVHWLRHTGISEDVKHRPREHVRDDAGHSSSATTDRYIDVELKERAHSAKNKTITKDD